ncbi:MAG TPA: MotA/TolQ/ExbB proton channel family protein [Candidatus Limnocylindria bacterium]|nr:MotA/TolQ/ExbB proton channel family protein [Candidatus Limnocylindria bacterium]
MMNVFMGNALWALIKQSDTISKLVLVILLVLSILCWSIFLYKLILFRIKRRQLQAAVAHIKDVTTLEKMIDVTTEQSGTLPGYFLSKNLSFLKTVLESGTAQGASLSEAHWKIVQQRVFNTVDDMVRFEEAYLPVISTSASIAPLLGLFGTVWGLVHAFIGISQTQTADIAAVAPGIAEALITTLAGLMVAIPAMIMFNYLIVQVGRLEQQMLVLADRFTFVLQRLFLR